MNLHSKSGGSQYQEQRRVSPSQGYLIRSSSTQTLNQGRRRGSGMFDRNVSDAMSIASMKTAIPRPPSLGGIGKMGSQASISIPQ